MTEESPRQLGRHAQAVAEFLASATYLDSTHAPSVEALRSAAAALDVEVTAALLAQFGVLHRALLKVGEKQEAPADLFVELLER
jgi:precorrin-4 methylase